METNEVVENKIIIVIVNSRFLQNPQSQVAGTSLFAGAYPKNG